MKHLKLYCINIISSDSARLTTSGYTELHSFHLKINDYSNLPTKFSESAYSVISLNEVGVARTALESKSLNFMTPMIEEFMLE